MHVHSSTGAAFTRRWRLRLLRLLCLAAFSNALMPAIDGTASTDATFRHYTPIRSAEPSMLIRAGPFVH